MQILTGNRFDITMMQWRELLAKAEKQLADSRECLRRFGDEDSAAWIKEDEAKVNDIKSKMEQVEANMRARGWKPSKIEALLPEE